MLPLFCLRLSLGMMASLLILNAAQINPRFYRTHFLTVLGLSSLALVSILTAGSGFPYYLLLALFLAFAGSFVWSLEGTPGGYIVILLTLAALAATLHPDVSSWRSLDAKQSAPWWIADDLTTSALLGFVITAMLMGHSYLIAPAMSLAPLKRLMLVLYLALLARAIVAGASLWLWTASVARFSLTDVALMWLPLRWGLGLIVPAVLGFMAWRTTILRNTQSSTGILYVTVVFVFLGELTAQLLLNVTGYFL